MSRNRLNMSLVRTGRLARIPPGSLTGQPGGVPDTAVLTRRQMLWFTGAAAAAVGGAPLIRAVGIAIRGTFRLVGDEQRLAVVLGGQERWVIDPRRFAGQPRLHVQRSDSLVRLQLTGARYPGTELPADLGCELRRGLDGWQMNLALHLGGFTAEVPFENWLTGMQAASSRVRLDGPVCGLGASGALSLSGASAAQFSPDWVLQLHGTRVARLSGPEGGMAADHAAIALLGPADPSLMRQPADRRTLIALERGKEDWPLWPAPGTAAGGRLLVDGSPFDQVRIETAESRSGNIRQAFYAEPAAGAASRLAFIPALARPDNGGQPFRLPLRDARYAVAFDPAGDETALVAHFNQEPAWLHRYGASLELADPQTPAPPFEYAGRGGTIQRLCCAPALQSVVAPLAGVVTEPVRLQTGARLALVAAEGPAAGPAEQPAGEIGIIPIRVPFSVSVVRPDDLLSLRFDLPDFDLHTFPERPPKLVRKAGTTSSVLRVHFQAQHIAEQAMYETDPNISSNPPEPGGADSLAGTPPVKARMAGPTRLVFRIPDAVTEIPYTLASLLHWAPYQQAVAPTALPPDPRLVAAVPIAEPTADQTAIEAPYRLILSPHGGAGWAHDTAAVTHGNRTELWHTRLGVRVGGKVYEDQYENLRTLRAIWSPDYVAGSDQSTWPVFNQQGEFRMSLTPRDRHELVKLTADLLIPGYFPQPVNAERFMLSTLGAWIDTQGGWDPPLAAGLNIQAWRHRSTMARDHFVRVVYAGFLFPYGHPASLIKVSERKFRANPEGKMVAYLFQRMFIVVRQPVMTYPLNGQAYSGRNMPFKQVRITTLVTPNLNKPENSSIIPGAFWPRVGAADFQFHLVGTDADGRRTEYTSPLVFVLGSVAVDAGKMLQVWQGYDGDPNADRRRRPLHGQKVAYAPSDRPGDTHFETDHITFSADVPFNLPVGLGDGPSPSPAVQVVLPANQPKFFPRLAHAEVRLAAARQTAGKDAPAKIKMHPAYLNHAFQTGGGQNPGAVFAKMLQQASVNFGADKSGGVGTPNLAVDGLSRIFGAVTGQADDVAGGTFDPASLFPDTAKILGGIALKTIIDAAGALTQQVPLLKTSSVFPNGDTSQPPIGIETTLKYEPKVKGDPLHILIVYPDTKLKINGRAYTDLSGGAPGKSTLEINGILSHFDVDMLAPVLSFILIKFNKIAFSAKTGQKTHMDVDINKVEFTGPLSFVESLKDYLKSTGAGPYLDVNADGVKAGFQLPIPNISVGVFSLNNISLGAGVHIPFSGDPVRMRFNFSEKENPFHLGVMCFSGGGFFALAVGLDGVELFEASFEFGGQLAIDVGVASGEVHIFAGIYFKIEEDECTLTGYVRLGGSLSILGLVHLSLEFNLSMTYQSAGNKLWGQATLTVEVEVLMFSASVDVTVERQFVGDGGDPTFAQTMLQPDWDYYAAAYA